MDVYAENHPILCQNFFNHIPDNTHFFANIHERYKGVGNDKTPGNLMIFRNPYVSAGVHMILLEKSLQRHYFSVAVRKSSAPHPPGG